MFKELLSTVSAEDMELAAIYHHNFKPGYYVYVDPKDGLFQTETHMKYEKRECIDLESTLFNISRMNKSEWKKREMSHRSQLISTNKSVDSKKKILSNNYLSFFVKGENIKSLTSDIIDNYYNKLKNWHNDKYGALLYEKSIVECGEINSEKLEYVKKWILSNIEVFDDIRGYIYIYFLYDIEEYRKEEMRYIINNIFLDRKNVTFDNNKLYGTHSFNFSVNSKKPYSISLSQFTGVPQNTITECIGIKRLQELLGTLLKLGTYMIFFDTNRKTFIACAPGHMPESEINGYFVTIQIIKKQLAIVDFHVISQYSPYL